MPALPSRITRVEDYQGQSAVVIWATQLPSEYSAGQARKIVQEWCDFFASGPTPIEGLEFVSRTPKRLFESLSGQTQLVELKVKWGDYSDLRAIAGAQGLQDLSLHGASKVTDLGPLAELPNLESLSVEGFVRIEDPSPLGHLSRLRTLELGGNWMSPRIGHLPNIDFLSELPGLERLLLHTVIIDSKDYSPALKLERLKSVRIMKVRGMSPSIEDLQAALPWEY